MATNTLDGVGALPDELLLDIFARLPDPIDLLRCAATCIRWLRLLAADDAAFLRRAGVVPDNKNASLLLGAFYQNENPVVPGPTVTEKKSDFRPKFWRLSALPPPNDAGRRGFGLFSILPNDDKLFNYAKPLASRQGLLLVRLMPTPLDYRKLHLAVCHPLLGGVHHVPPPPLDLHPPFQGRDVTGYALITGYRGEGLDNKRQRRLAFRVLFTAVRLDGVVNAYSYSSATGSWSAPTMCPMPMRGLIMSGPRAGAVDDRGTAHWLYRDKTGFCTLNVTANAARISFTAIPMQVQPQPPLPNLEVYHGPFPCIAGGGKVSFLYTPGHDTLLQLWTRQDHQDDTRPRRHIAGGGWQSSDLAIPINPYDPFKIFGFAESTGAILVKSNAGLSCLDLESKKLELIRGSERTIYPREVCSNSTCQGYNSCTQCAYNNCVLYEMDWSSYLLHLSAWSPRGTPR